MSSYHRFHTKNSSLTIAPEHYVFVDGEEVDPATVTVGTMLNTPRGVEAVTRIEATVELGAYHIIVAGGAYYADGILVSDFSAGAAGRSKLGLWKHVGRPLCALRFAIGLPVTPALMSMWYALDKALESMGLPAHLSSWLSTPAAIAYAVGADLTELAAVHPAELVASALVVAGAAYSTRKGQRR